MHTHFFTGMTRVVAGPPRRAQHIYYTYITADIMCVATRGVKFFFLTRADRFDFLRSSAAASQYVLCVYIFL